MTPRSTAAAVVRDGKSAPPTRVTCTHTVRARSALRRRNGPVVAVHDVFVSPSRPLRTAFARSGFFFSLFFFFVRDLIRANARPRTRLAESIRSSN